MKIGMHLNTYVEDVA